MMVRIIGFDIPTLKVIISLLRFILILIVIPILVIIGQVGMLFGILEFLLGLSIAFGLCFMERLELVIISVILVWVLKPFVCFVG